MVRTIVSLDSKEKAWLDKKAKETGHTMTYVVREAIRTYRSQEERSKYSLDSCLKNTRGRWKKGDGLAYQRKLRNEWR